MPSAADVVHGRNVDRDRVARLRRLPSESVRRRRARGGAGRATTLFTAVLVTHIDPPVHGQSVMAAALVEQSASWMHSRLVAVNTIYSRDRESLVRFSLRKAALTIRYLCRAVAVVRRHRAQFVIVTPSFYAGPFLKDALMILALRAFTGAKVIAWVHMDPARIELGRRQAWYKLFASHAIRRVDCWVACAPRLLAQWPSFIPQARRVSITNGTSVPAGMSARRVRSGEARICYVSSLDSSKGWTDLLEAADDVCDEHEVEFHFYGGVGLGWASDAVVSRFRTCRHRERIVWHGPVWGDRKWDVLSESHIFCFPSRTEQFPLAVLEAMASGLPIVATRVGAIEDAVIEGRGGWLVSPGAPRELANAIEEALEDPDRLARFGAFNEARQRREFSVEAFGREWERFLSKRALSVSS